MDDRLQATECITGALGYSKATARDNRALATGYRWYLSKATDHTGFNYGL